MPPCAQPPVTGDTIKTVPAVEQRLARKARKAQQQEEADEEDTEGESSDESQHDYMDEEEEQEFFDKVVDTTGGVEEAVMFSQLNLSRPFLRAIEGKHMCLLLLCSVLLWGCAWEGGGGDIEGCSCCCSHRCCRRRCPTVLFVCCA